MDRNCWQLKLSEDSKREGGIMFRQLKNIDSAFKHVRIFSCVLLIAATVISCYAVYRSYAFVSEMQQRIYVLADGRALLASQGTRKENIPVEARRHLRDFHAYFFTLAPDEQAINANIKKALYLADESAKRTYDDLKENGYYSQVISSNISQERAVDSIHVSVEQHPYQFTFYGKQRIIRPLSITIRRLVTTGYLRDLQVRTDNNPAAFLIERWAIIDNKDLEIQKR